MKKTALFAALLCLAQSTLHADVPLFINYQGKVADSTGLPIGASGTVSAPTAAPVNRKVIFRIYDASTGGNRLWTEEQTATISLGVFSVLLGNGINPTGTASTESRPALDTIFTPSAATSRFLEIMVDNGDNSITASDVPISPRQQITSTAFALHAKVADGIASSSDLTINPVTGTASNYGLGWYGAGRTFNSVAVDGPVLYGNSGGALGSNASGTQKLALAWNAAGQVGVGASSSYDTNNKLTLQGDDSVTPARQLVIRGNTDPTKRLNIGYDTSINQGTLQSYTAASTVGNLLLNPSGGNVSIGSATAPAAKLSVGTPIYGDATTLSTSFVAGAGTLGQTSGSELLLGNFAFSATGNSESLAISGYRTAAGATWADTALVLGMNVDVTKRSGAYLSLHSTGNVGIGTLTPSAKLDVNGNANVSGNIYMTDGPAIYGKSTLGAVEAAFWPRSTNGTYLNYGTNGFYIRNNASTTTMTMTDAGNVGIGTTPAYKLDVNGTARIASRLYADSDVLMAPGSVLYGAATVAGGYKPCFWPRASDDATYLNIGSGGLFVRDESNNVNMRMTTGGIVQLGTAWADARLNVGSINSTVTMIGYLDTNGGQSGDSTVSRAMSIRAEGLVLAGLVGVASDLRIKTDLHATDSVKDLDTLMGIEVTDYQFKDKLANGNTPQKKAVAQQLEKVYPQAVNTTKGMVPDIYQKAEIKDGWVALATDLKVGDRVRLISDKEEGIHEVMEVKADRFLTQFKPAGDQVFVYGREVNDFRSVDYDAIAMLNVSATQQLKREKDAEIQALDRQLKEKDAKIAALEAKVAAQDKRSTAQADEVTSQNARLIALEKLMNKAGAPETVSIKLGDQ